MTAVHPLRVLVCGTNFGRFYVQALRDLPGFALAGISSRGSAHATRYAESLGVPCYTAVDQLPDDIDLACVAVPSGVAGGGGAVLARQLLERGVHVLQEHPLDPDELAGCLRAAGTTRRQYRVNTHYPRLPEVRRFIAAATRLRDRQNILFVDIAGPVHLLHPLVDILAQALGGPRPWEFGDPIPVGPVRMLDGRIAGVPAALRVHNQLDPTDVDNHALFWPRITLVAEGGTLTLADLHGPVLWSPRLHAPRDTDHRLVLAGGSLELPTTSVLSPAVRHQPAYAEHFRTTWPAAIGVAITELAESIHAAADPMRGGGRDLAVCRCWHQLTERLGPPEPVRAPPPRPLGVAELTEDGAL